MIAYSTCSQLGYMFFAAGVGAYGAAMFHLFTHAFFKALLFLGAGSVIHAMHHEQDMRFYGGLRKEIPITFWVMMAGTLAITGVGIDVGGIGFAGFYSKDAIIESACASGTVARARSPSGSGVFAALLTSFYSLAADVPDLLGQAALGRVGAYPARAFTAIMRITRTRSMVTARTTMHMPPDGTGGYHPHESPLTMLVPIGLLAVGALSLAGCSTCSHSSIRNARRILERQHRVQTSTLRTPRTKCRCWVKLCADRS